jgi:hypothetical protein
MASWVGLGGNRTSSTGLEQIGTEADCTAGGRAIYSSWFELVPSISAGAHVRIRPGDVISASVTVRGRTVRLRMANDTLGTVFTRRVRASAIDVSSADWIVEAPTLCLTTAEASCRDTTLADFGSTGFSRARATAGGRTGPIADPGWSTTAIALVPAGGGPRSSASSSATAAASALSGVGDSFSVFFGAGSSVGGIGP